MRRSRTAFNAASELGSPATGTVITARLLGGATAGVTGPKRSSWASSVRSLRNAWPAAECHVAVDDDGGRGDLADGEVAVEDDVSLLGERAVRQGGEAGRARVDIEVGDRADQQQRDGGHDGDDAVAHDQIDRAAPESLMRRGRFLGAAAEERHPQRFHTIAE